MSSSRTQKYDAWFECSRGCEGRWELTEIIYKCPHCDGLLTVQHDLERLKKTPPQKWMKIFESRAHTTEWPYGSGVWGKRELVCPVVAEENVVSMFEGHTNLFWAKRLGQQLGVEDLWVKQCGNTHTGSFKDLGMTVLVSVVNEMRKRGQDVRAVACASTGDTSAALAAYAAYAGIPALVLLPQDKVSLAQLVQPVANGAITLSLQTDFDGCMEIMKQIAEHDGIYMANSMNPLRIEGQKTIGMEIVQQFDWEVPDWIVIPVGNLGNVSALGKGLLEWQELGIIDRLPRICAAQAANADPLYLSYKTDYEKYEPVQALPTLASAIQIGNPVSYDRAVAVLKRLDGVVEEATEDELSEAAAEGDLTGLYNCPHTGVALAAMKKLIRRGEIKKDQRVVVISTAHGLKFTDFKVRYHASQLSGVDSRLANPPIVLPARYDVVRSEVLRQIEKRFGA